MINQKQRGLVRLGKQAKDSGSYYMSKSLGEASLKVYMLEKSGSSTDQNLTARQITERETQTKTCTAACSRHILQFTFELSLHKEKYRSRNTYTEVNKELKQTKGLLFVYKK